MLKKEFPVVPFKTVKAMETWLTKNHAVSDGIWLRFYKKGSGTPSVTRDEAIDVALCFGWIDSQLKKLDDVSWLHKFTPRKARSIWSKRNIDSVLRLTKDKRMKPAGLAQADAAKKDGRWKIAYDKPSDMTVPADFVKELKKHPAAFAFFNTLNKANLYAIAWRLRTAKKPETRKKRFDALLAMLKEGKKLH